MLAVSLLRIWNETTSTLVTTGYALFHIEAEIVAAIVLAIIFNHQLNTSTQTEARVYWLRLLATQFVYCITSIFRVLVNVGVISTSAMVAYTILAMNFMSMHLAAWLAFVFVEVNQPSFLAGSLKNKILTAIPLILEAFVFIFSPMSGATINFATGSLKIGPLFTIMMTTAPLYYFASTVLALIRRAKMSRYERDMTGTIEIYPATLFVVILIQAMNWKIPLFCNAIMIADIYMYIRYSDSLVSIDPLTKILNRNGITFVLSEYLKKLHSAENMKTITDYQEEEETSRKDLYVIAVDVDDLGEINSMYGHFDGDKVLILVAEALKKFSEEAHDCYVSRYYGDEFILVAEIEDEKELEIFIEHVRNYVANAAITGKLPYHLRVNVGHAKYEKFSKLETISGLVEEATKNLNEFKEQRKFQNFWQNDFNPNSKLGGGYNNAFRN